MYVLHELILVCSDMTSL